MDKSPVCLRPCSTHGWDAFLFSSLTLVVAHSSVSSLNPGRPTVLSCLGLRMSPLALMWDFQS